MTSKTDTPKDRRVIILRVWSNTFEADNDKGHAQCNSLKVVPVKLRGRKDWMFPYANCFKTFSAWKIFVRLLEELCKLWEVSPRYWGKDKQCFPTINLLELTSNDYLERCFNHVIYWKGNYTKRFGHFFLYDKAFTLSFVHCLLQRIEFA